jgi:hypothetical protein
LILNTTTKICHSKHTAYSLQKQFLLGNVEVKYSLRIHSRYYRRSSEAVDASYGKHLMNPWLWINVPQ